MSHIIIIYLLISSLKKYKQEETPAGKPTGKAETNGRIEKNICNFQNSAHKNKVGCLLFHLKQNWNPLRTDKALGESVLLYASKGHFSKVSILEVMFFAKLFIILILGTKIT